MDKYSLAGGICLIVIIIVLCAFLMTLNENFQEQQYQNNTNIIIAADDILNSGFLIAKECSPTECFITCKERKEAVFTSGIYYEIRHIFIFENQKIMKDFVDIPMHNQTFLILVSPEKKNKVVSVINLTSRESFPNLSALLEEA